jgi:hypothetical protein
MRVAKCDYQHARASWIPRVFGGWCGKLTLAGNSRRDESGCSGGILDRSSVPMRIRARLLRVVVVFSSLALSACTSGGPSTTGAAAPKLPLVDWNCLMTGQVRPARIVLACGDGNAVAENLTWLKWNSKAAVGMGKLNQNDCAPDCAQGTFHLYPARFVLSETVPAAGRPYFTRVTVTFADNNPAGQRVEMVKDCYDTPPAPYVPRCPADLQGAG